MAAFSTIALVGGLALSGVRAYQGFRAGGAAAEQGRAEREALEAQADLAEFNANVADLQARDAIVRGAEHESRFRAGVRLMIGEQRAGFAASGVDVGFGSPVDVTADTAKMGELDALMLRTNAAREAWGLKVEAEDYRRRASILRMEGGAAVAAGQQRQRQHQIGAFTDLVGSGLQAGETYYRTRATS